MRAPTLILFDVDGTLVDDAGLLFPAAAHVVQACAQIMTVALCSARPFPSLSNLCHSLPGVSFISASQGGVIASRQPGSEEWIVRRKYIMTAAEIAAIHRVSTRLACELFYHGLNDWFVTGLTEASERESRTLGVPPSLMRADFQDDIYKVVAITRDVAAANRSVQLFAKAGIRALRSKPTYLEIGPTLARECKGAVDIQELLDLTREDTIAIGDAENDLGAFACACISFTFDKAPRVVQESASYILRDPERSGLRGLLSHIR